MQYMLTTLLSFFAIISFIVFVHEFGHYWVAKKCGVKIDAFSIGFGPEIFGFNDKSGTRWKFCAVPMGGYVKMYGDASAASNPDSEKLEEMSDEEKTQSFYFKSVGQRIAIVFAGPLINFILAVLVFIAFFAFYGIPFVKTTVGEVVKESAAEAAGIMTGDKILAINGAEIRRFEQVVGSVGSSKGEPLTFTIKRGEEVLEKTITPKKDGESYKVGIAQSTSDRGYDKIGFGDAVINGFLETYHITKMTAKSIYELLTGKRPFKEVSGIIRIADYSGESVRMGFDIVLRFIAVLSINLGLVNLFPIPMLDGGHIFYYLIEAIRGKPLPQKVQEFGFKIGFALVITLMIFALRNDLIHFKIFGL
jgi:regulator of sigma E protease